MVKYTDSTENITPEMLEGFFQGWKKPHSTEDHLKILRNSDYVILAIDTEKNKVIGFITALTDNVQSAFIPLLEVLQSHRNQGIGTNLVSKMLKKLKEIPAIDVTCDPELQKFYAKFGMISSSSMVIRNY